MSAWLLYVVETADGTLYTGITTDLARRIKQHNAGKGAKYTALRRPVCLLAAWITTDRSQATRLERRFKRLSRGHKLKIIHTNADFADAQRLAGAHTNEVDE